MPLANKFFALLHLGSSFIPYVVAGAIQAYDLPDLMACQSSGKLLIIDPLAADGSEATGEQLNLTYEFPERILNSQNMEKRFELYSGRTSSEVATHILEWLK